MEEEIFLVHIRSIDNSTSVSMVVTQEELDLLNTLEITEVLTFEVEED